jgi:cysteine synthase A
MISSKKTIGNKLEFISARIGHTPLVKLDFEYCNLFAKLECHNPFGSIKDRPAFYILQNALTNKIIDYNSIVIESTSGNFGIALANICKLLGIKFIAVIDPAISMQKEQLLRFVAHDVIKVKDRDETGGFLLNRIKVVKEFLTANSNAYNPNQYQNPDNYLSYYHTLGNEIGSSFTRLDYAFISVSSGGTIIGLSTRLKQLFPKIKIIAVDIEGSMIFSDNKKFRHLSGIGASMRSPLMDNALIDDVIILSHLDIINGAHELLNRHAIFSGASSGAAYIAARNYLKYHCHTYDNAVFISPDSGDSYLDTIFSDNWIKEKILKDQ